jgi:flagellar basal-body rod protein FlgF
MTDNPSYVMLSRQSGLLKELRTIANNIANAQTTGFKKEGALFSEYVSALDGKDPSLSIGRLGAHYSEFAQGTLNATGGDLDVAIEGEGFFLVESANGERLSRAGHFMRNVDGLLVNPDGMPVLDEGGGQVQIPFEASKIVISPDGTISADGNAVGRLGVVTAPQETLIREGANLWIAREGHQPVENPSVAQGYLEASNVEPVSEIARLIDVQRSYEAGQTLLEKEDERIEQVIRTVRQA